jgi:Dullard-like phosphatase family protein
MSKEISRRPSYKLRTPDPIHTSLTANSAETSDNRKVEIKNKENLTYEFAKANSLQPNMINKPLYQNSCRSLKTSNQRPADSFKVKPNSARNRDGQGLVTKVESLSKKSPEILYKEHLFQTFQAVKFIRSLPEPDVEELRQKAVILNKRPGFESKRTIVFDLDETLVHCVENPDLADFAITINLANGNFVRAGVNIRPFAREVLASANRDFEVIVFTASHKCYADEVMNYLDPTGELIHHRLYRENCLVKSGVYIKDLRIFVNRRVEDIVIVDNSAYCFAYQLENGIPIISWFDDYNDRELQKLVEYIKILAHVPDISLVNQRTFRLNTFYHDYIRDFLKSNE